MNRNTFLICALLVLATTAAYWPIGSHEFVNYDDNKFITENDFVKSGLTREGIRWAFSFPTYFSWQPLTWLSHMTMVEFFGLEAGPHLYVNLLFHVLTTLLLFLALKGMTGAIGASAAVACLFALHPLRVESVAWATERKDVLSTMFWMLTLVTYQWYVARPGVVRYLPVIVCFALGLMSKPMLVTLPAVLLLLDFWPLGRLGGTLAASSPERGKAPALRLVLLEKLPLLVLALASSALTYFAPRIGKVVIQENLYPLTVRVENALIAAALYLKKLIWPTGLAVFYPHPGTFPLWQAVVAGLLLTAITAVALWNIRRRPYLLVGWLWYLGTLMPVSGLVQVGNQVMADRFTYVPHVGLLIALVWFAREMLRRLPHRLITGWALVLAAAFPLFMVTRMQVGVWQNSVTLFTHAVRVTTDNWLAHYNLGLALESEEDFKGALHHYEEAVRIRPEFDVAHNNLAITLARLGRTGEAIESYRRAISVNPRYAEAYFNLGLAYLSAGRPELALAQYRALRGFDAARAAKLKMFIEYSRRQ